ncbi:hypothetical protein AVEN_147034-1, partial [Araneus ventricosus]
QLGIQDRPLLPPEPGHATGHGGGRVHEDDHRPTEVGLPTAGGGEEVGRRPQVGLQDQRLQHTIRSLLQEGREIQTGRNLAGRQCRLPGDTGRKRIHLRKDWNM